MTNASRLRCLVVHADHVPEELRALVRGGLPDEELDVRVMEYAMAPDEQRALLGWAEVVLLAPGRPIAPGVLSAARDVKLMQLWSSGWDRFNTDAVTALSIPVANNGGANAVPVAEHTVLLMLAVLRRLPELHRRTVAGRWEGNGHGVRDFSLAGKQVGLVGLGRIGRLVAARVAAFGARVLYADPVAAPREVEQALGARRLPLPELLAAADVVSLHLHLNEQTRGLLDEAALARMKPGAVLINVSRAALIDTAALRRALERGALLGAGLDVFEEEPTKPGDPLLAHERVVATPHAAGSVRESYVTAVQNAVENFRRVARGEAPRWVVNGVGARP